MHGHRNIKLKKKKFYEFAQEKKKQSGVGLAQVTIDFLAIPKEASKTSNSVSCRTIIIISNASSNFPSIPSYIPAFRQRDTGQLRNSSEGRHHR